MSNPRPSMTAVRSPFATTACPSQYVTVTKGCANCRPPSSVSPLTLGESRGRERKATVSFSSSCGEARSDHMQLGSHGRVDILKYPRALLRQERLGMKQHAFHQPVVRAATHDVPVFAPSRDLEFTRNRRRHYHERMIAPAQKRIRQSTENALTVVPDQRRLAVNRSARSAHLGAQHF